MVDRDLSEAIGAACQAGAAIRPLYGREVAVTYKEDRSPLTEADRASHELIVRLLRERTPFPVLSEESRAIPREVRRGWDRFWLVDPLDGTKEFLKRNGEFTVNIALIEEGSAVLGVVYAPVLGALYAGRRGLGAFKVADGASLEYESVPLGEDGALQPGWVSLPCSTWRPGLPLRVVASRSHGNPETDAFIADLEAVHGPSRRMSSGSSLKLCLIAEGAAEVYPRLAPTMEWDTAAAQALVEASGGTVLEYPGDKPLRYNKADLHNPHFVAYRRGWPMPS